MVQLIYMTKRGAGVVRTLPNDKNTVLAEVQKLRTRGVETTIRRDGQEIGHVWKLDGRWVYCYDWRA